MRRTRSSEAEQISQQSSSSDSESSIIIGEWPPEQDSSLLSPEREAESESKSTVVAASGVTDDVPGVADNVTGVADEAAGVAGGVTGDAGDETRRFEDERGTVLAVTLGLVLTEAEGTGKVVVAAGCLEDDDRDCCCAALVKKSSRVDWRALATLSATFDFSLCRTWAASPNSSLLSDCKARNMVTSSMTFIASRKDLMFG